MRSVRRRTAVLAGLVALGAVLSVVATLTLAADPLKVAGLPVT